MLVLTIQMDKKYECSICKNTQTGYGNNAQPINNGKCCNSCNYSVVIPERMQSAKNEYMKINWRHKNIQNAKMEEIKWTHKKKQKE